VNCQACRAELVVRCAYCRRKPAGSQPFLQPIGSPGVEVELVLVLLIAVLSLAVRSTCMVLLVTSKVLEQRGSQVLWITGASGQPFVKQPAIACSFCPVFISWQQLLKAP